MSNQCFETITEGHKKDPEYQIGTGRKVKRYLIAVPHDFDPKSFNGVKFSKKKLELVTESGKFLKQVPSESSFLTVLPLDEDSQVIRTPQLIFKHHNHVKLDQSEESVPEFLPTRKPLSVPTTHLNGGASKRKHDAIGVKEEAEVPKKKKKNKEKKGKKEKKQKKNKK